MARLPRGIKITNWRREGDDLVCEFHFNLWAKLLLLLAALRRVRFHVRVTLSSRSGH